MLQKKRLGKFANESRDTQISCEKAIIFFIFIPSKNIQLSLIGHVQKGGNYVAQLQLDGTTCFQWRHSGVPSFLLFLCVK